MATSARRRTACDDIRVLLSRGAPDPVVDGTRRGPAWPLQHPSLVPVDRDSARGPRARLSYQGRTGTLVLSSRMGVRVNAGTRSDGSTQTASGSCGCPNPPLQEGA